MSLKILLKIWLCTFKTSHLFSRSVASSPYQVVTKPWWWQSSCSLTGATNTGARTEGEGWGFGEGCGFSCFPERTGHSLDPKAGYNWLPTATPTWGFSSALFPNWCKDTLSPIFGTISFWSQLLLNFYILISVNIKIWFKYLTCSLVVLSGLTNRKITAHEYLDWIWPTAL